MITLDKSGVKLFVMKKIIAITVIIFIIFSWNQTYAQGQNDELQRLIHDDSTDVRLVAGYPNTVRENIFKVSTHPEAVVKIHDIREKYNGHFKNLISSFSRDDQQNIYDLTRYENLISRLSATGGKKSKIENVLKDYPADIHDKAARIALDHHSMVMDLDKLNKDFKKEFDTELSRYLSDYQQAYRELLQAPEALSLLNRNMHLTTHLGNIYEADKSLLIQQFDSLSTVVAEENTRESEEWEKQIKNNPDAEKELRQSAEKFASENNFEGYNNVNTNPQVIEHYVYLPYPYWAGYPWWHPFDYWYPYPFWYHSGFYIWNGTIVWIGPPSWYFIHWHFHHHHFLYDYPHLTNLYINHYYYGPRRHGSMQSVEVHQWMNRNETALPRDFETKPALRAERIKALAKSEMDREEYNRKNPDKNFSRDEFMKDRENEYPQLKQPVTPPAPVVRPENKQPEIKPVPEIKERPVVKPAPRPAVVKPRVPPMVKERPKVQPVPPTPQRTPAPQRQVPQERPRK